jgi:hypothetical protein
MSLGVVLWWWVGIQSVMGVIAKKIINLFGNKESNLFAKKIKEILRKVFNKKTRNKIFL